MREEIKIRWVDRLRSTPKEKQHKGEYSSDDGSKHCAIGVLRQMGREEGIDFTYRSEWMGTDLIKLNNAKLPSLDGLTIPHANDAGVSWDIIADAIKNDL